MFEKKNRYSFRKGVPRQLFTSPSFVIRYQKHANSVLHCSVVVGKKVDKRAVVRNKIKRMLVAHIKEILPEDTPFDMVIYARRGISEVAPEQIRTELEHALSDMKIE